MIYLFGARVAGPLEPYVVGYCEHLARLGFTEAARAHHMSLVAHLSRWLAGERHEAGDLIVEVAHRYLGVRAAGYSEFRSPQSLDRLLAYLRDVGAAPPAPAAVLTATDVLVARFRAHLLSERGLRPNGADSYVAAVLPFVARVAPDGSIDSSKATAREVMTFLSDLTRSLAPATVQRRASALRALLRFWFLDGAIGADLSVAVPKVAHRPAGLPRGLPADQVTALLGSCDLNRTNGSRDRAILTLLARMGLRAGEVAGLRLDDLDWRQGEVVVHGKGGHIGFFLAEIDERHRPAEARARVAPLPAAFTLHGLFVLADTLVQCAQTAKALWTQLDNQLPPPETAILNLSLTTAEGLAAVVDLSIYPRRGNVGRNEFSKP